MTTVPLNGSTLGIEEEEAWKRVWKSGRLTMGNECLAFEKAFAEYVGTDHAVFVNSGSSANLLAFFALANPRLPLSKGRQPLKPGDEVLVPAVTWSTSVWPILQAGAIPVFVDVDPKTLQTDLSRLEEAISPKTKAICIVHLLGGSCNMDALLRFADKHNLWVVEDTCEALGSRWKGSALGSLGTMGTYSFYFSHHMTTIEGGMVVTQDEGLADLLRALRAHGWTRHLSKPPELGPRYAGLDPRFCFINMGFNVRPTEINAVLGLEQLKKLEAFNKQRREIFAVWQKGLERWVRAGHFAVQAFEEGVDAAPFAFPIVCATAEGRNALQAHLEGAGIETRPLVCGNLLRQPAFEFLPYRAPAALPGADALHERGLYWGLHPVLTEEEVAYVLQQVDGFYT